MNKAQQMRLERKVHKMTLTDKARLCSGADFWHTETMPQYGIDSLFLADGPCGLRIESNAQMIEGESLPATCFPSASALACSFDRDLLLRVGQALGKEAAAAGVDILLGPAINIKRSPLGGRNFEYFSEDPYLSGELGAAQIEGIQSAGIGSCVKHYAANSQENRRMVSDSILDKRALHEIYLEAFRIAIKKSKPYAVMSSYNKVNGEYAGESPYLIQEVLRNRFGFDGIVMSDWGAVCDRVQGIRAGLDLEMPGKVTNSSDLVVKAVNDGVLDEQDLNRCVLRILHLIDRCKKNRRLDNHFSRERHHDLCCRAAAESTVLLKNNDHLLPFSEKKTFAVIGCLAERPRYQGGGSSRVCAEHVPSVLDRLDENQIRYLYAPGYNADGSTNPSLLGDAKKIAQQAGQAVIFVGLPEGDENEGQDRDTLSLPEGVLKTVDSVLSVCPKTAVYLMVGSPVLLPFADHVKSIVCGYLGGQGAGVAAADILTGHSNPSGHLAESWPRNSSDVPCSKFYGKNRKLAEYKEGVYIGYRYYIPSAIDPLFAFGHGLSYTSFTIDSLQCDRQTLARGEEVKVTFRIRNTGKCGGYAVAQIYIAPKDSPHRTLRQFEKVYLSAGEARILTLHLDVDSFSIYDKARELRVAEMGQHTIMVAASSAEIIESVDITVWDADGVDLPPYPDPAQMLHMDDEAFFDLLGYTPKEPERTPYTMNSTLGELRHRTAGTLLYNALSDILTAKGSPFQKQSAEKMLQIMEHMPLRSISALSRGQLSYNKAMAVVHLANRNLWKGIYHAIRK